MAFFEGMCNCPSRSVIPTAGDQFLPPPPACPKNCPNDLSISSLIRRISANGLLLKNSAGPRPGAERIGRATAISQRRLIAAVDLLCFQVQFPCQVY